MVMTVDWGATPTIRSWLILRTGGGRDVSVSLSLLHKVFMSGGVPSGSFWKAGSMNRSEAHLETGSEVTRLSSVGVSTADALRDSPEVACTLAVAWNVGLTIFRYAAATSRPRRTQTKIVHFLRRSTAT